LPRLPWETRHTIKPLSRTSLQKEISVSLSFSCKKRGLISTFCAKELDLTRFSKGDSFLFGIFFLDFRLRFFETAEKLFSTFRQQFLQLFFVATKFLFAVDAAQGHVRRIREAFGTGMIDDFPTDQKDQRGGDQRGRERVYEDTCVGLGDDDEHKRGTNHREVPVVDAASATAPVMHDPGLKGAKEEDADHVADRIGQGDEDHDSLIEDVEEKQSPKDGV